MAAHTYLVCSQFLSPAHTNTSAAKNRVHAPVQLRAEYKHQSMSRGRANKYKKWQVSGRFGRPEQRRRQGAGRFGGPEQRRQHGLTQRAHKSIYPINSEVYISIKYQSNSIILSLCRQRINKCSFV